MSSKRISRRGMLKGLGLAMAGVALGACQPKATETTKEGPVSPEKIELNFFQQDPYGFETWDNMYSIFEEAHPGVTIPRLLIPFSDIEPKVLTALAAGESLDAIYVHMMQGRTYALKGAIIPLDEYWPTIGIPEEEWTPSLHAFSWRGKEWVLPFHNNPYTLGYNPVMMEEAGLESPRELHKQGKWTAAVFDEYVRKLTKGEGPNKVFGTQWLWRGSIRIMQAMYFWGHDTDMFSEDESETLINTPEAIEAWEHMASYQWEGLAPAPGDLEGVSGAAIWERIAFGSTSRTNIKQIVESGVEAPLRTCPMFAWPNGRRDTRVGVAGMAVFSKSEHKDMAWEFVRWLATDGHQMLANDGWCAPLRKSMLTASWWVDQLMEPYEDAVSTQIAVENGRWIAHVPRISEIDKQIIQPAWENALLKQVSVQEAMDGAKPEADEILRETAETPLPELS